MFLYYFTSYDLYLIASSTDKEKTLCFDVENYYNLRVEYSHLYIILQFLVKIKETPRYDLLTICKNSANKIDSKQGRSRLFNSSISNLCESKTEN